jgi:hypothetical protein
MREENELDVNVETRCMGAVTATLSDQVTLHGPVKLR